MDNDSNCVLFNKIDGFKMKNNINNVKNWYY